ncbi:hypothetical protein BFJ70_g6978 [Fusarium oxysporum]|nr:hypothetical protein BFJ70_g6978 [Fusarium oxysporum]
MYTTIEGSSASTLAAKRALKPGIVGEIERIAYVVLFGTLHLLLHSSTIALNFDRHLAENRRNALDNSTRCSNRYPYSSFVESAFHSNRAPVGSIRCMAGMAQDDTEECMGESTSIWAWNMFAHRNEEARYCSDWAAFLCRTNTNYRLVRRSTLSYTQGNAMIGRRSPR